VTQCRPTLIHYQPRIKFSDGLIAINGLYRHGFLIAHSLAEEVMNYIRKGESARQYEKIWEAA